RRRCGTPATVRGRRRWRRGRASTCVEAWLTPIQVLRTWRRGWRGIRLQCHFAVPTEVARAALDLGHEIRGQGRRRGFEHDELRTERGLIGRFAAGHDTESEVFVEGPQLGDAVREHTVEPLQ